MDNTLKYIVKQTTQAGDTSVVAYCINRERAQSVLAGMAAAASEFVPMSDIESGPMHWLIRHHDGGVIEQFWIEEMAAPREAMLWPDLTLPPINLNNAPAPSC